VTETRLDLGVRRRPQQQAAPLPAAGADDHARKSLDWRLDEQQGIDPQTQQKAKSKWSDLSKTTRGWLIAGGVITLVIIVSAMD
jgi:hypothetical protein